jgi:hypothetical protein
VYDYDNNVERAEQKLTKVRKLILGFKKPFTHKRLIKSNVLCAHLSDYIVHWCFATEAHLKLIDLDEYEQEQQNQQMTYGHNFGPRFEEQDDVTPHRVAKPLAPHRMGTNWVDEE